MFNIININNITLKKLSKIPGFKFILRMLSSRLALILTVMFVSMFWPRDWKFMGIFNWGFFLGFYSGIFWGFLGLEIPKSPSPELGIFHWGFLGISNPRSQSPGIFWSSPKWKIPIPNPRDGDRGLGIPKQSHPKATSEPPAFLSQS